MIDEGAQQRDLENIKRTLRELPPSVAASFAPLVADLQQTIYDLLASQYWTQTETASHIASPGAISPTSVSASGDVSVAGTMTSAAGLSSPGAYLLDVSTLPGGRQTVWQHNSGAYGFAPSTVDAKVNIGPVTFTAADVRAVAPRVYQYKAQIAIREDPQNAYYDADYVVPWEVGLLAEDLVAHNMSCFVVFEEDGTTPKTINYDLFAAVTTLVLAADFDARLRALESSTA